MTAPTIDPARLKAIRRGITPAMRERILDVEACHYCGALWPDIVEHVVPVAQGGGVDLDNLVAACRRCNVEKGAHTPDQWAERRLAQGKPWPIPSAVDRVEDLLTRGIIDPLDNADALTKHVIAARDFEIGDYQPATCGCPTNRHTHQEN
ncbi:MULTISPECIES: HNH endonuclease [Gordonia]|uniref:HNH endonuclease n=1 Tax=Gordonia TaxID=2053 RepID=UPI000AFA406E|nr:MULTISPECIES: HNH endonuclease [Gordonia]